MSTHNENPLVTLIRKSVGLPAGKSSCCGAPAGMQADCCGVESPGGGCCGASSGGCCDAEGEAAPTEVKPPAQSRQAPA